MSISSRVKKHIYMLPTSAKKTVLTNINFERKIAENVISNIW